MRKKNILLIVASSLLVLSITMHACKITAYDNAENFVVDDNEERYYVYTVVPEFPATLFLSLFIIFTLVAVILKSINNNYNNGTRVPC